MILIVIDTLRADHLGIYGYERRTSPNIDRWARDSVVFDRALATSPWTLPSVASILTGQFPSRHGAGAWVNRVELKWRRAPLGPSVDTLPELLARQGMVSGAIVSNPFLSRSFGTSRGFDSFDYAGRRRAGPIVDLAIEWIDMHEDQHFFLMLHFNDPHMPYDAPAPVAGTFAGDGIEAPRHRGEIRAQADELSEEQKAEIRNRYDEEIAFADGELGRFFDWLEERTAPRPVLVVLTSDHGEELFDHGDFEHGHTMYQELLRVPLIVRAPGVAGRRESTPVSLVDLMPTLVEATRGEAPPVAGVSLWPLVSEGRPLAERQILAEFPLWVHKRKALVQWPYKLILAEKSRERSLYDLASDPYETEDLAAERPELADHLESALRDQVARQRLGEPSTALDLSRGTEQELRALGYFE